MYRINERLLHARLPLGLAAAGVPSQELAPQVGNEELSALRAFQCDFNILFYLLQITVRDLLLEPTGLQNG